MPVVGKGFKLPKTIGGMVGLAFKLLGVAAIVAPGATVVYNDATGNNLANLPKDLVFAYTGVDISTGTWSQTAAVGGLGAVVGGTFFIWLGKQLTKVIR